MLFYDGLNSLVFNFIVPFLEECDKDKETAINNLERINSVDFAIENYGFDFTKFIFVSSDDELMRVSPQYSGLFDKAKLNVLKRLDIFKNESNTDIEEFFTTFRGKIETKLKRRDKAVSLMLKNLNVLVS